MKHKKGFTTLLMILLVILGISVLGVGYALYKYKQEPKKLQVQVPDSTPTTTNTLIPIKQSSNSTVSVSSETNCYGHNEVYSVVGNGSCIISPDGESIVYPTNNGLRLIQVGTGKTIVLSKSRYDVPMVWFSDSKKILGFTGPFSYSECGFNSLSDCGADLRSIVTWDLNSKTYNTVPVKTPALSYDMKWLVPDHTALITAEDLSGTEGDNFSYTLDLDKKSILLSGHYQWKP